MAARQVRLEAHLARYVPTTLLADGKEVPATALGNGDWEYTLFYDAGPDPDDPGCLVMQMVEFPDPRDAYAASDET